MTKQVITLAQHYSDDGRSMLELTAEPPSQGPVTLRLTVGDVTELAADLLAWLASFDDVRRNIEGSRATEVDSDAI